MVKNTPRVMLVVPKRLVEKLDIVSAVDERTRSEVMRDAIREYLDDLDWKYYAREHEDMTEDDSEEEPADEDSETESED